LNIDKPAENFIQEQFWYISVTLEYQESETVFNWSRNHLFDRAVTLELYQLCLEDPLATVTSVVTKPKEKWRPLPLTTVELQKMASIKLRMNSDRVMNIAEALYNRGYISYVFVKANG
jgi:DNA topoisomerase-3